MAKQPAIIIPEGCTKVLLHACCAPCSSAIVEWLLAHQVTPVIYYFNPNIYPLEEYEIRKNESKRHAASLGIEWIDDDGERGVQYFVEALYRVERNKPAADLPSKKAISKLFFTKSKKNLDIGKNSLYCWGKNKSIDHSHSQEKKIEGFLDIIDKALKPSGMSS